MGTKDTFSVPGGIPQPALDRRASGREPNPPCPVCGAKEDCVQVTIRTAHLIYFKCTECGRVWQGEMPAARGQRRWDR